MLCIAVHCWLLFSIDRLSILQGLALCWRSRGGAGIGLTVCRGLFPCFFFCHLQWPVVCELLHVLEPDFGILFVIVTAFSSMHFSVQLCPEAAQPREAQPWKHAQHRAPCEGLRVCNAMLPRFVAAFAFAVLSASSPHTPLRRKECLNLVQKAPVG